MIFIFVGCSGKTHKQDRHNCSLMVNFKLFLDDLTIWRIHITGQHVPDDKKWEPPPPENQIIGEELKDEILSRKDTASSSEIQDLLLEKNLLSQKYVSQPSRKKFNRLVADLKRKKDMKQMKSESKKCLKERDDICDMNNHGNNTNTVVGRDNVLLLTAHSQSQSLPQRQNITFITNPNLTKNSLSQIIPLRSSGANTGVTFLQVVNPQNTPSVIYTANIPHCEIQNIDLNTENMSNSGARTVICQQHSMN